MRIRQVYICDVCGKESISKDDILLCESQHFGLTPKEKERWDYLKYQVEAWSRVVSKTSNNRTRSALDDWTVKLLAFEAEHGMNKV